MSENDIKAMVIPKSSTFWIFIVLVAIGVVTFIAGLVSEHLRWTRDAAGEVSIRFDAPAACTYVAPAG